MKSTLSFQRPTLPKRGLSARSKLTMIFIALTLTAVFIIGALSWQESRTALNDAIFSQLTSIRSVKARQVENYFDTMRSHLQTLTEDETIIAAMVRFNKAFRELDREHIPPLWDVRLETYYEREFLPRLSANLSGTPEYDNYRPRGQAATYLQYYYLAANVEEVGNKKALDFARDESSYSEYHAEYHPWLRDLTAKFDYYDLFLIDFETGNIVYSVEKEVDFATNLLTGPYFRSGLAQVVQAVQNNPARHAIQVVDFQFYQPSYNAPAAFIAGPIYNGPHVVGILAFQFPLDKLDAIMTGNRQWQQDGLGATGETYLVGADQMMRSQSRLLLEDPEQYRQVLLATGAAPGRVERIVQQGTSILRQDVRTEASTAAIAGTTDTRIIRNYRGNTVLSAFTPLQLDSLSWALLVEIDVAEAFAPVTHLTRVLIIAAAILAAIVTFLSLVLSGLFMRPVMGLINDTQQFADGVDDDATQPLFAPSLASQRQDEFGELARTYQDIITSMRQQRDQLEADSREYLNLLFSNLPDSIVERFRNGERRIIEHISRATVLFVRVSDYADLVADVDAEETATLLNELDDAFHEAALRHDLTLFKLIGQQYVAVCGLTSQRLDHARRSVDLAISMRSIVNNFNMTNESHLAFQAGIDSGAVIGGIIGAHTFSYDLWGDAVRVAQEAKNEADVDTILVTEDVYQQVQGLYAFLATELSVIQFGEELRLWQLETQAQPNGVVGMLPYPSAAMRNEQALSNNKDDRSTEQPPLTPEAGDATDA